MSSDYKRDKKEEEAFLLDETGHTREILLHYLPH